MVLISSKLFLSKRRSEADNCWKVVKSTRRICQLKIDCFANSRLSVRNSLIETGLWVYETDFRQIPRAKRKNLKSVQECRKLKTLKVNRGGSRTRHEQVHASSLSAPEFSAATLASVRALLERLVSEVATAATSVHSRAHFEFGHRGEFFRCLLNVAKQKTWKSVEQAAQRTDCSTMRLQMAQVRNCDSSNSVRKCSSNSLSPRGAKLTCDLTHSRYLASIKRSSNELTSRALIRVLNLAPRACTFSKLCCPDSLWTKFYGRWNAWNLRSQLTQGGAVALTLISKRMKSISCFLKIWAPTVRATWFDASHTMTTHCLPVVSLDTVRNSMLYWASWPLITRANSANFSLKFSFVKVPSSS